MPANEDASAPATERRFSETEVAAIFAQASEAQDQSHGLQLPSGQGLTLSELREIGREVGISSDEISKAAYSLSRGGAPALRGFLGSPIGVRQTIDLGRRLSDDEWERLVVDLRETFDARGTVRKDGFTGLGLKESKDAVDALQRERVTKG